ncbi:hypothetical protein [Paraburkholderia sp. GAS32]|uniref:hypothetical protein n=1 Tax=Paraburkholderia sp. GAS32 TaxID=3035129 RepID=UPI003D24E198
MNRKHLSYAISIASLVATLYCFWLAVEFFRGEAAFWPISILNGVLPANAQLTGSLAVAFASNGPGLAGFVPYYAVGLVGYVCLAGIVTTAGSAVSRIALVGWTKYQEEQEAAGKAEQARQLFTSVGELVTIRTTVASGFLSSERFTEVETTTGVFVVDGEVGTVSKGLAVSKNDDQLRIGGLHSRTYPLRSV